MNSELKYWYLHHHQLFRNLSFSEINALCIIKKFKKSLKSEMIELPYTERSRIYFLKKGALKLMQIDEDGNEIVKDFLQQGDLFGELTLQHEKDAGKEFMKVLSDEAIICTFYKEDLENLMLKKPDFALSYIKFVGFNFTKVKNSYSNILFKDTRTRLILFLLSIINKEEIKTPSFTLPNYLTQNDIAQLICTSRQTTIALFNELEEKGILKYSNKQLFIPNIDNLRKLVKNVK